MFYSNRHLRNNNVLNKPVFIAVISVLTIVWSMSVLSANFGPRATPVVVSVASEQFLAPTIKVPGTIVSGQQSELPAEVGGRLIWVAQVGTKLKVGDVVARLDHTLYELRAEENKANLKREMVRLDYLDKEVVRLKALIKGDFSSKNTLDKMQLDRDVARSEVAVARAKIKIDEETLRRYKVYAPFQGVVIDRERREGEWVQSGETVVTFSNPDNLEIDARVSDKSIGFLKEGEYLNVYHDGNRVRGLITAIVRIGDVQSHLFDIKINASNQNWLAGQAVRVEVPTGQARKTLAVLRDALVLRRGGTSVFRVNEENKSEKISVTTSVGSGEFIGIEGNVQAGDKIVVRGGERLRPGQLVKIIPGKSQ